MRARPSSFRLVLLVLWPLLVGFVVGCKDDDEQRKPTWTQSVARSSDRSGLEALKDKTREPELMKQPAIAGLRVTGATGQPGSVAAVVASCESPPPYVCTSVCEPVRRKKRRKVPKPQPSHNYVSVDGSAKLLEYTSKSD